MTRKTYKTWSAEEDAWLRENYPLKMGIADCAEYLGRPQDSIRGRIFKLRLHGKIFVPRNKNCVSRYFIEED